MPNQMPNPNDFAERGYLDIDERTCARVLDADANGGALLNAQRKPLSYTVDGRIPSPQA